MSARPITARHAARAVVLAALVGAGALGLAGCGSDGESGSVGLTPNANVQAGKELFTAKCGSCHALADAGSAGTIGPDLDDAFRRYRIDASGAAVDPTTGEVLAEDASKLEDAGVVSTIRQVVRAQIQYPIVNPSTGAPGMPGIDTLLPECTDDAGKTPAGCVPDQDRAADEIASYVASVAGLPSARKPSGGGATDGAGIFAEKGCGGCHTLAKAGSTGTVGPNLDETKPSLARAIDRITNGRGGMPAFKGSLDDEQIKAVAEYVSTP